MYNILYRSIQFINIGDVARALADKELPIEVSEYIVCMYIYIYVPIVTISSSPVPSGSCDPKQWKSC